MVSLAFFVRRGSESGASVACCAADRRASRAGRGCRPPSRRSSFGRSPPGRARRSELQLLQGQGRPRSSRPRCRTAPRCPEPDLGVLDGVAEQAAVRVVVSSRRSARISATATDVGDVRLAGQAVLPFVGLLRHAEGALEELRVGPGVVGTDLLQERVDRGGGPASRRSRGLGSAGCARARRAGRVDRPVRPARCCPRSPPGPSVGDAVRSLVSAGSKPRTVLGSGPAVPRTHRPVDRPLRRRARSLPRTPRSARRSACSRWERKRGR